MVLVHARRRRAPPPCAATNLPGAALAALLLAAGGAAPARAEVIPGGGDGLTRCAAADADVAVEERAFEAVAGDTGWLPADAPAQIRLTGRLDGHTTVAMGLRPTACWDPAMGLTAPGRGGAGLLDFAYGAQLHVLARIHTNVLGNAVDWEGELPVSILPTDLMLADTAAFTPGPAARAEGFDRTSPVPVISTDVIGALIGIAGISGGLHIDVAGALGVAFRATDLETAAGALPADGSPLALRPPAGGFGPSLPVPLEARGVVTYAPGLVFSLGFNVKILGVRVVDWQLGAVTMPLPSFEHAVTLRGDDARLPLPASSSLAGARVDFAAGATQRLRVHNRGDAPLRLTPTATPPGVTVEPLTVAPGADGELVFGAADGALAAGSAVVAMATDDPDQPAVEVEVGRDVGGTDPFGGEGGGCAASGGGGLGGALVAALARRGRRRRR